MDTKTTSNTDVLNAIVAWAEHRCATDKADKAALHEMVSARINGLEKLLCGLMTTLESRVAKLEAATVGHAEDIEGLENGLGEVSVLDALAKRVGALSAAAPTLATAPSAAANAPSLPVAVSIGHPIGPDYEPPLLSREQPDADLRLERAA